MLGQQQSRDTDEFFQKKLTFDVSRKDEKETEVPLVKNFVNFLHCLVVWFYFQ